MHFLQMYTPFFIHFPFSKNPIFIKTTFFYTSYKVYLFAI